MEVAVNSPTKRNGSSRKPPQPPPWADLPSELLGIIITKLPFYHIHYLKSVCSSWRRAALTFLSSPLSIHHSCSSFLMLLSHPPLCMQNCEDDYVQDEEEESIAKQSIFFYNLKDKSVYKYRDMPKEFNDSRFVGSSHGRFLVLVDKNKDPYLVNMLSRSLIKLPPKDKFPHIRSVRRKPLDLDNLVIVEYDDTNCSNTRIEYRNFVHGMFPYQSIPFEDYLDSVLIQKAILSNNNNFVIIIYGNKSNLGYCRLSDTAWTHLHDHGEDWKPCTDILCSNNKLHASLSDNSIAVWDFNSYAPIKVLEVRPSMEPITHSFVDYYSTNWYTISHYLVESCGGDVLLVTRNWGDAIPGKSSYRKLGFNVYKLDVESEKWIELESLGDQVVFLGWNHSLSLSVEQHRELKGNSIYYTDSYLSQIDGKHRYRVHDMSIYSLEDGSFSPFMNIDVVMKTKPPTFHIVRLEGGILDS